MEEASSLRRCRHHRHLTDKPLRLPMARPPELLDIRTHPGRPNHAPDRQIIQYPFYSRNKRHLPMDTRRNRQQIHTAPTVRILQDRIHRSPGMVPPIQKELPPPVNTYRTFRPNPAGNDTDPKRAGPGNGTINDADTLFNAFRRRRKSKAPDGHNTLSYHCKPPAMAEHEHIPAQKDKLRAPPGRQDPPRRP